MISEGFAKLGVPFLGGIPIIIYKDEHILGSIMANHQTS